ncbi:hypothetical protein GO986_21990 [Deinococcus sp. HMF7620]|uniref:Uncharacterized protein n=1 Tax=Deinococcus arboris TaxID=2682977 RepID=A0A7C9I283_9DEIO|nr:hypothetical protein [Deinococcus arboris]MVN89408.1 hypothetical protein [Deinococcus arboris]
MTQTSPLQRLDQTTAHLDWEAVLRQVQAGQGFEIVRDGQVVACLLPVPPAPLLDMAPRYQALGRQYGAGLMRSLLTLTPEMWEALCERGYRLERLMAPVACLEQLATILFSTKATTAGRQWMRVGQRRLKGHTPAMVFGRGMGLTLSDPWAHWTPLLEAARVDFQSRPEGLLKPQMGSAGARHQAE